MIGRASALARATALQARSTTGHTYMGSGAHLIFRVGGTHEARVRFCLAPRPAPLPRVRRLSLRRLRQATRTPRPHPCPSPRSRPLRPATAPPPEPAGPLHSVPPRAPRLAMSALTADRRHQKPCHDFFRAPPHRHARRSARHSRTGSGPFLWHDFFCEVR